MNGSADPIRAGLMARLAMILALLLASGLLALSPAAAAAATADPAHAEVALAGCVAPQRAGDTPQAVLADRARFDCRRPQSDWGAGNFWVRLAVPPALGAELARPGGSPLRLRFVPQWQQAIALYTRDRSGMILARTFDNADLSRLIGIGAAAAIPLEGHGHPVSEVLLRVDGALNASGLIGEPALVGAERLHVDELVATAIFAAFAGLGIGLFCYNIVLWLTIRERFQLTYCLSLLAMMAYVWSSSGALAVQFPAIPQDMRLSVSYAMLAFVAALALQFITDIMEPGTIPPRVRAVARNYGVVFVATALAVVLAPDEWRHLADRAYVFGFIPLPPLVLGITFIAARRGSRAVRVLAVAWAVPLVMGVVRIAHALHLIPQSMLVQYALVVGMGIEALLSSLAMSYRIKRVTAERDQALADERAARHLASVDSLTGLLNRRALLEQVIDWASPEPLRLLIVDIDHFKQINDRHGHLVGDEVLREIAEVLAIRADLRASVARLGGEEFALIGTADELGEAIALGVLSDIRSRTMAGSVRATASVGMAEGMVRCEDEWRELYRRADAALYQAKSAGRNRAVHAASECAVERDRGIAGSDDSAQVHAAA